MIRRQATHQLAPQRYWGGPFDGTRVSRSEDEVVKLPDLVGRPPRKAWAVYRRGNNWLGQAAYLFDGWEHEK